VGLPCQVLGPDVCRKWQPGVLLIDKSPVALRLALTSDLPL